MRLALLCIHKCKIEATIRAELLLQHMIDCISSMLASIDGVLDSNYFAALASATQASISQGEGVANQAADISVMLVSVCYTIRANL